MPSGRWLLAAVPVALVVGLVWPERHTLVFFVSVLAILPLAAAIGRATEALASRLGGGIGGLLNATFGNAAELIIGALALRAGHVDLLLLLSYVIAPAPMDLHFTTFELVAIGIAVLSVSFIAHDGETHWIEGVQLLAVYVILALGFFFLPGT
jgi:Ca2+/H+ antiporter